MRESASAEATFLLPQDDSLASLRSLTSKFLCSSSTNNKLKGKRSSMAVHGWKAELRCYEEREREPLLPPAFKPRVIFLHLVSEHSSVFSANALFLNCENLWVPARMIHFPRTSSNWGSHVTPSHGRFGAPLPATGQDLSYSRAICCSSSHDPKKFWARKALFSRNDRSVVSF